MTLFKGLWFLAVQQRQKGFFWVIFRFFLRILSLFYFIITKLHSLFYRLGIIRTQKLPCYVISIGNITAGGTGKTPFVLYLAEKLLNCGYGKIGILSRGYGRKYSESIDDEAFPLQDNIIRIASPDRFSAGIMLINNEEVKTIILDDGFQHLILKRDLDIVLIDATNPFGTGWLLPFGILREPVSSLARADIIVITHSDLVIAEQLSRLEFKLSRYNKKTIKAIHKPQCLVLISQPDKITDLSEIKNKAVWEFCGLGNPYQFHRTVSSLCNIKGLTIFPDHHYYSQQDIDIIFERGKKEDVSAFITTEKDALRLKNIKLPDELPFYCLKIKLEITEGEEVINRIVASSESACARQVER
jgi:tetraacyldisaccharide 4'-kinase